MTDGRSAAAAAPTARSRRRRIAYALCALYAVLLALSHAVWSVRAPVRRPLEPGDREVRVRSVSADGELGRERVDLVVRDVGPADDPDAPVLLLLHGSPGSSRDFHAVEPHLARWARVVTPDLPGFGRSAEDVPDVSIAAHARYAAQLLDALGIERCHVVGFSMGGGVALHLADDHPERVESVTLLAAIGAQEYELFGDHDLNHFVHRAQLAAVLAFKWAVPHFGAYDRQMLRTGFARNFYESDQRPLRGILERWEGPLRIVHGSEDFLVPLGAAREHRRIVPQSELEVLDASHFIPWTRPEEFAASLRDFVERVERGEAPTRATAEPERVAEARVPFDAGRIPPISGFALVIGMILIAAATLLTEDLTCIAVGLVIAQGRIGYLPGTFACFCGIFFGDVLLYLMGRFVGRAAMGRRPLRWWLTPARIDRASTWFRSQGIRVIFVSRFLPGFRVPTYFAAGVLKTHFLRFASYFAIAVALWTPVLVGLSAWAGKEAAGSLEALGARALPGLIALALLIYFAQSLALPMFSHRGRRLLVGRFRRKWLWEYWHPVVFYAPVVVYVLWLALKHRSLTLFTAANPGIPTGGFIGESKSAILAAFRDDEALPRSCTLGADEPPEVALERALAFVRTLRRPYPVVLKPDQGQRGSGVLVLEDEAALANALAEEVPFARLLQEFVAGPEYGVFWIHLPGEPEGRIFSITEKILPVLVGDGERTLEELILDDERAVCMAMTYLNANAARIMDVPARGERVQLVDLGTHCLGAVFRDGARLETPALRARMAELAASLDGFCFGRFDLRAPDEEAFRAGRDLRVLEVNGVTSEATHIYDPAIGLAQAYEVLFEQWRTAFEIGRRNAAAGRTTASVRGLTAAYREYRRQQSRHLAARKAADVDSASS